ncbi:MAG: flagellar motor protein MotB [Mariprofundaceae bacterium]
MSAKREKKEPVKIKTDGWVATFGDLISLMLTFFVLLVSMSSMDEVVLKNISESLMQGSLSVFEQGSSTDLDILEDMFNREVSLQELMLAAHQHTNRVIMESAWKHKVRTEVTKDKVLLRLPNSLLFSEGQARLGSQDVLILRRLARQLIHFPGNIRVEGHTGPETLPKDSPFPNSRALSLARAASVLHALEKEGISQSRLSLAGYGSSKPLSTNATPFGRSMNRRVDIVLYKPISGKPVAE